MQGRHARSPRGQPEPLGRMHPRRGLRHDEVWIESPSSPLSLDGIRLEPALSLLYWSVSSTTYDHPRTYVTPILPDPRYSERNEESKVIAQRQTTRQTALLDPSPSLRVAMVWTHKRTAPLAQYTRRRGEGGGVAAKLSILVQLLDRCRRPFGYITLSSRGLFVMPGTRPLRATGRPSTS